MALNPWIAGLLALFLWWFSTGVILMAVRFADNHRRYLGVTITALPMLAMGIMFLAYTAPVETPFSVYSAFVGAILVWGWIELAFLTGIITGPNTRKCPHGVPNWERFLRAWGTIAYHEIALLAGLFVVGFMTFHAPNSFGFWTFAVLFFARISAKLNLFLGVQKINTEFLPTPLSHLPSYFRHARMNWLFPVSVTALTFAAACWMERIYTSTAQADIIGFSLLAALTALATIEHWLLVLPLPDEKLWRWMLPNKQPPHETTRLNEEAHGL